MPEKIQVKTDEEAFVVEKADSFISRLKGLSFRNSGKMLFIFPRETKTRVDMMFLSRPLYLYFMDSEKKIIEFQKAEPWTWDPKTWKLYSPDQKYRYLLESFEKIKVEEGESLIF